MNIKQSLRNHEECIELLQAIDLHTKHLNNYRDSLKGIPGQILSVKNKILEDIKTTEDKLALLNNRYSSILKQELDK